MQDKHIKKANLLAQADCIREAFANIPPALEQIGILLVGTTGSGKSTLANYLLETPLIRWDDAVFDTANEEFKKKYEERLHGHLYPAVDFEDRLDLPQIGGGASSKTKYITSYTANGTLLFDTPGFNDTDANQKLANALTLERMINQVAKLKLAIVIEYGAIETGRSEAFKELVKLLGELLTPDALNNDAQLSNALFLFTDKAGRVLRQSTLKRATEAVMKALISEKASAPSQNELDLLELGIKICEAIIRTPNTHIISISPMDKGASRLLVHEAVKIMQPVDATLFNFNTQERLIFRDELKNNYIIPHLNLMYHESICYELKSMNQAYYVRLSGYTKLPTYADKLKKIKTDLEEEEKTLYVSEIELPILQQKLDVAEQELNNDLRPDEEIEFVTLVGDERLYTTSEILSMGVAGVAAAAVGTVFGVYSIILALGAVINKYPLYSQRGSPNKVSDVIKLWSYCTFGTYRIKYEIHDSFEIKYKGNCFTRAELRYQQIDNSEHGLDVAYYEIHTDKIIESPDKGECTAIFQKKFAHGPQQSQVLCILGKRENHPELGPVITAVRNEIGRLKMEITKCENRIAMAKKVVNILKTLINSPDESTLNNLIEQFNITDPTTDLDWTQSLQALLDIHEELDAVNTILTYVPVPGILKDYQNGYQALLTHNSVFGEQQHTIDTEANEGQRNRVLSFYRAESGQTLFERTTAPSSVHLASAATMTERKLK